MKNMMDVINGIIPESEFGRIPSQAELQEAKKNLGL
jgi:hypothetical protein